MPVGQQIITPQEVKKAIYIDYEGSMDNPPTLLGYLIENKYEAGIVEPLFNTCAERFRARKTHIVNHENLTAKLLRKCEEQARVLVSWSEHDYNQMLLAVEHDDELVGLLDRWYRNAIYTARRWRRKMCPGIEGDNSLSNFCQWLDILIPERFGVGIVGKGLRYIRPQLIDGRDWPGLTDAARKKWCNIYGHNKYDLECMHKVVQHCADRVGAT